MVGLIFPNLFFQMRTMEFIEKRKKGKERGELGREERTEGNTFLKQLARQ